MTDLLTKEERETVEQARKIFATYIHHKNTYQDTGQDLLAIIDNLSKRGVKKCSEEELRAGFEAQPIEKILPPKGQDHLIGRIALHAWLECARFLGALEEK